MTVWAIIPLRASPASKSRLSGVLDETARAALVDAMLARVLAAAHGARNVAEVRLIGSARTLPADVTVMTDPGRGLNAAAAEALNAADGQASRVIVIHGDLPQVTVQDIELLAAAPEGEIAIAPDRHGTGTNAISLPLPAARGFSFAFGTDSFALHNAEAGRMGLGISEVHSAGLSRDVDEPDDLSDAADLLKSAS